MSHVVWVSLAVIVTALLVVDAQAQDRPGAEALRKLFERKVEVKRDVAYVRRKDGPVLMDLFLPRDRPAGTKSPVVIWVHGGGWKAGSKEPCPAALFALDGYVVASINYRLIPEHRFPAQIDDCRAAVRFLREHAGEHGIDPERIGVWGASAGGHLAALMGVMDDDENKDDNQPSSRVQAVCDWFGPSNLLTIRGHYGQNDPTDSWRDNDQALDAQLLGGKPDQRKEKAMQASPVNFVSEDDPPFLIMHGAKDRLVPLEQSRELTDKLKAAGVDVTLIVFENAGHGDGEFTAPATLRTVKAFFDKHLAPR